MEAREILSNQTGELSRRTVMIERQGNGRIYLITQPDHAALARRIMEHWEPLREEERRASILLAIGEHDNGWREPDAAPSIDPVTGRVHDFINAPAAVRQSVWPRGVARLSHDPWAAALVAQHALTVYERYRTDETWSAFFREMADTRDAFLAHTSDALPQLANDYDYVRIGDLISLIFCNRWEEQSYKHWAFRLEGNRVVVMPDAFGGREIPFEISAIELPQRRFTTDTDLRAAIDDAPQVTLRGTI
jgi:hypothetical protein